MVASEAQSVWSTYHFVVQETMLDFMGHVNNATYLTLFEEARWDAITKHGYGFEKIQELQQGPVILEVNLKYLKELRLRENISIETDLLDYSGKVGRLRQRMRKQSGELVAEAIFVFGLLDMRKRALVLPTPEWAQAVGAIVSS